MRAVLLLFGFLASALAVTTPDVEEVVDVVKCIKRCTGFLKVDPSFVQPCLDSCNLSLGKNIKETLARMPVFKDPAVAAVKNDDTLYRDGLLLQSDITTLNKAISYDQKAQPGNLFASLFSNLGFLQPSNSFASPAQPTLGTLMKIPETIIKLLEQVIKNQQVIEQRIVGCKAGKPLIAPATSIKGNYNFQPNFEIPINTRIPIISPNAGEKRPIRVQKRDAYDGFFFSGAESPNANDNFPSELDKFPYEEDKYPVDDGIKFPNDRR